MKILIVHNKYKSRYIGGEDIVFRNEIKALKKTLGEKNIYEYSVNNDEIKSFKIIFTLWFSKYHYKQIYQIIKKNHINIVHVHNFYPLLTLSIFKAAKKAGVKTVHTLHNYRLWCISGIFYRKNKGICELCKNKRFAYPSILYKCYRNSYIQSFITTCAFFYYKISRQFKYIDYFFVLTPFQKNKVISLGVKEQKIFLKPNFIRNSNFQTNKKDFIYVGKMDQSKGVLKLVNVWKNLDNKYQLKLIGSGELDEYVRKLNLKNIHFFGTLDNKRTLEEIRNSRYLVATSLLYETFGLTIIEAMSVGTPVIGFNIGTRNDFIFNKKNGFLCASNELQQTIIDAYNFQDYNLLSKNAKEFSSNFVEEKIIQKQISIYKNIINENINNNPNI